MVISKELQEKICEALIDKICICKMENQTMKIREWRGAYAEFQRAILNEQV